MEKLKNCKMQSHEADTDVSWFEIRDHRNWEHNL